MLNLLSYFVCPDKRDLKFVVISVNLLSNSSNKVMLSSLAKAPYNISIFLNLPDNSLYKMTTQITCYIYYKSECKFILLDIEYHTSYKNCRINMPLYIYL